MTSRGWIIPADARVSTLCQFKKEYDCEVDFIVKDFDDFHFDDRGRLKDLAQNTRARFDIVVTDGLLLLPVECLSCPPPIILSGDKQDTPVLSFSATSAVFRDRKCVCKKNQE